MFKQTADPEVSPVGVTRIICGKFLVLIGLTLFLAGCGSKDLSEEKSRTSAEMKQLEQRMLTVQTDR